MYAISSMKRNQLTMCAEEVNVLAFTDHDTISAIAEAMESWPLVWNQDPSRCLR